MKTSFLILIFGFLSVPFLVFGAENVEHSDLSLWGHDTDSIIHLDSSSFSGSYPYVKAVHWRGQNIASDKDVDLYVDGSFVETLTFVTASPTYAFTANENAEIVFTDTVDCSVGTGCRLEMSATSMNVGYSGTACTDVCSGSSGALYGRVWGSDVAPPSPTVGITFSDTSYVTDVGTTSATFNSSISDDGSGSTTLRGFYYVLGTSTPTDSDNLIFETGTFDIGSYSLDVVGLATSTTYTVLPYGVNENGTSTGTSTSFVTDDPITITYSDTHSDDVVFMLAFIIFLLSYFWFGHIMGVFKD